MLDSSWHIMHNKRPLPWPAVQWPCMCPLNHGITKICESVFSFLWLEGKNRVVRPVFNLFSAPSQCVSRMGGNCWQVYFLTKTGYSISAWNQVPLPLLNFYTQLIQGTHQYHKQVWSNMNQYQVAICDNLTRYNTVVFTWN